MRALLCSALLALTLSFPARAGNLLDLAVVDRDTGETLITYMQDGRLYVAGAPGHRYAVRLTNRTGARVLAVMPDSTTTPPNSRMRAVVRKAMLRTPVTRSNARRCGSPGREDSGLKT